MGIAKPAVAAAQEHDALAQLGQIGKQHGAVLLIDLGADRHFQDGIGAIGAVTVLAHAGAAIFCKKVLLVAVVDQRVETIDGLHHHVAAIAAVAAVRAAELDEFLAAKRDAAVASGAGTDVDLSLVEKFHR